MSAGHRSRCQESYDPQTSLLDQVETTDSTSTDPIDTLTYTYGNSADGVSKGTNLVSEVQDVQNTAGNTGTTTAQTDTQCFTYDYAQRLSEAWTSNSDCLSTPSIGSSSTVGGPISPYWQSWTYNAAGDRLSETDYDTSGVTANDTDVTYNYPTAGVPGDQSDSLTSTSATGPNAAQQTATYQYDADGNESSVTGGELGNESYNWNDQGQLQSTTSSAGTTSYAYDTTGAQLIMRDPGSTTLNLGYAQLVDTAGTLSGTRYYSIGGVTIAERTSAGVVSILVPDRQGTDELAVSATAAQTVTRRQYLPFGGLRDGSASWVGGDKGYVGGSADPVTGLESLGVRTYDAVTGRFLSLDPVFELYDPTQLNGYSYSANDPVTLDDPSGQWPNLLGWAEKGLGLAAGSVLHSFTWPLQVVSPVLNFVNRHNGIGAFNNPTNGWELGYNWLLGVGPRNDSFGQNDAATKEVQQDWAVQQARITIANDVSSGADGVGSNINVSHHLGGGGFGNDLSNLGKDFNFFHGLKDINPLQGLASPDFVPDNPSTGNSMSAFLGSYTMNAKVDGINRKAGTVTVTFSLKNTTDVESGFRPPPIPLIGGYSNFYKNNFGPAAQSLFPSGPMSPITENMTWTETFSYTDPEPPNS